MDGHQNNDSLTIIGSTLAEKVELRPGLATLESSQLSLLATQFESVQFLGGGGPDRAYLYDAATDDRLNIWPNKAELTGIGYAFTVDQVERIFVHAIQGGDDQAFVFDSVSNDSLSVRPQFTSLGGSGFFNYIAGFERISAYATAGGIDNATLYDSVGNDLFSTNGDVTSIVGPGFSTFARGFENVEAFSTAGGVDRATVHATLGGKLTSGADYVGMQDATRSSIARNFERVETFLSGQSIPTPANIAAFSTLNDAAVVSVPPQEDSVVAMPPPSTLPSTPADHSSIGFTSLPAPPASSSSNLNGLVLEPIDWIHNLVEQEIRFQRSGIYAISRGHDAFLLDDAIHSLDLSWTDTEKERVALDAIFSKHR